MLHVLRLAINNELFARPPRTAGDEWLLDITDNGFPLLLYYICTWKIRCCANFLLKHVHISVCLLCPSFGKEKCSGVDTMSRLFCKTTSKRTNCAVLTLNSLNFVSFFLNILRRRNHFIV